VYGHCLYDSDAECDSTGRCDGYFFRFADLYQYQCHPHRRIYYFGGNLYLDGAEQLYGYRRYGYRHCGGYLYRDGHQSQFRVYSHCFYYCGAEHHGTGRSDHQHHSR
jgi:hypothetical protein